MSGASCLRVCIQAKLGQLDVDIDFETGPGPVVVIGPNGSGKTSLLSYILGILPVTRGYVGIGGTTLLDTQRGIDVQLEERQIGYVPQDYALFPHLSVRKNIDFALACAPNHDDRRTRARRIDALLMELGLMAQGERSVHRLSGGEKQRVALARAISVQPRALLLDEPLAALDVHSRGEVRGFLATYLERLKLPTLVVTHDAADAQALGHRIAVLEHGRITQLGSWAELRARPASRFVEEFVGSAMPIGADTAAIDSVP